MCRCASLPSHGRHDGAGRERVDWATRHRTIRRTATRIRFTGGVCPLPGPLEFGARVKCAPFRPREFSGVGATVTRVPECWPGRRGGNSGGLARAYLGGLCRPASHTAVGLLQPAKSWSFPARQWVIKPLRFCANRAGRRSFAIQLSLSLPRCRPTVMPHGAAVAQRR